jgi:DNA-binding response OmpR family regulator
MPALDAFVVHLRHELRNPVNAIVGYSQLLLEEARGEAISEAARLDLAHIEAAGLQLSRLIGEILDPAHSAYAEISEYAVRLRHAVRTPVTSVQGYAELILEEVEGTPLAEDLHRIHSAAGHLLEVTDAIERLYLVGSGETSRRSGDSPPTGVEMAAALEQPPETSSGGGVVLIIEDEENNRALLARRLQRQGHHVILAGNGREGLAIAENTAVDVILLDILMPELSGYEVLARLKENEALREIPVLMITALDDAASVIRCIGLGAEDYLAKPFDPLLLRARVSSCLRKKRTRDFECVFLRAVAAVTAAATTIEAGAFDPSSLDDVGRRPDALGNLARLFQRLGVEVAARERRLREQVQQLTVEIDQRKKDAQVAEITESEYFRGLVERVRGLSSRPSRRADRMPR